MRTRERTIYSTVHETHVHTSGQGGHGPIPNNETEGTLPRVLEDPARGPPRQLSLAGVAQSQHMLKGAARGWEISDEPNGDRDQRSTPYLGLHDGLQVNKVDSKCVYQQLTEITTAAGTTVGGCTVAGGTEGATTVASMTAGASTDAGSIAAERL